MKVKEFSHCRFLVLVDNLHLRDGDVPLHVLRVLLERAGENTSTTSCWPRSRMRKYHKSTMNQRERSNSLKRFCWKIRMKKNRKYQTATEGWCKRWSVWIKKNNEIKTFLASYLETNRDANGGEKVVPQKQYWRLWSGPSAISCCSKQYILLALGTLFVIRDSKNI